MSGARGLLLDLDGTLVDSVPDLAAALNTLRAELGLAALPTAGITTLVGDGMAKLVQRGLGEAVAGDHLARFIALYEARLTRLTRPYPGVPETLAALADDGWRLGLCTNKSVALARAILEHFDLARYFAAITGGDSFAERKPHGDHPRATLALMEVAAQNAVLVGDSQVDLASARNAGLPVILVSYGYARVPLSELAPDRVIDRFAELPAALAALKC